MSISNIVQGEEEMKLDESNSVIFNGIMIATKPDETGAITAKPLPERLPTIPKSEQEREEKFDEELKAFQEKIQKLRKQHNLIASS